MSIADKITSIENHLKDDYQSIANLGADLTNVDKNIENIAELLDGVYDVLPKTEFQEGTDVTIENTLKGKLDFQDGKVGFGQASQESTQGYNLAPITNTNVFVLGSDDIIRAKNNVSGATFSTFNIANGETIYIKLLLYKKPTQSTSFVLSANGTDVGNSSFGNFQSLNLNQAYTKSYTATETTTCTIKSWGNANNEDIEFQLWVTKDNSKDTFEKYTNGASPNPSYPQEIKYVRGRNIVESKNVQNITTGYSDVLFTQADLKPSTTYTISFEGVAGNKIYANENLFILEYMTIPSGRASLVVTTKATISKNTRTQYQEENGGWLIFKNNGDGNPTANIFNNLQIEEGNEASPYLPFNIITETVKGKNLVNFEGWINTLASISEPFNLGTLDSYTKNSITITSSGNDCYSKSFVFSSSSASTNKTFCDNYPNFVVEVEPNTQYTFSFTRSNTEIAIRPCFFYLDKDYNYLSLSDPNRTPVDSVSITTPANAKYMTFRLGIFNGNGTTLTISNIMLVKGTDTIYEPYVTPRTYQFSLGDKRLYEGSTIVRNSDGSWKYVDNWRRKVFDGTINKFTSKHSSITSETKGFYQFELDYKDTSHSSGSTSYLYSQYLQAKSGNAFVAFANNDNGIWWEGGSVYSYAILEFTSLTDANNWLIEKNTSGDPLEVIYLSSTPIETPITDTTLIEQLNNWYYSQSFNGTTIIESNGDLPMPIKVRALKGE